MKKITSRKFDKQWQQTVVQGADAFGVALDSGQIDLLTCHAEELMKWNRKFNITAIVDPHEVAVKHFIDSIALCNHIPDRARVIDLGSGGGFPGLPLKIVKPSIELVMVDASRKRVSFLNHMIRTILAATTKAGGSGLNSSAMEALHVRAEDLSRDEGYARNFDVVISRAFTSLTGFTEMALPFLNDRGIILAMKGELTPEEITSLDDKKVTAVHTQLRQEITRYLLPFENHRRCVVKLTPQPA